jgi:hypothetical protein
MGSHLINQPLDLLFNEFAAVGLVYGYPPAVPPMYAH